MVGHKELTLETDCARGHRPHHLPCLSALLLTTRGLYEYCMEARHHHLCTAVAAVLAQIGNSALVPRLQCKSQNNDSKPSSGKLVILLRGLRGIDHKMIVSW